MDTGEEGGFSRKLHTVLEMSNHMEADISVQVTFGFFIEKSISLESINQDRSEENKTQHYYLVVKCWQEVFCFI